MSFILNDEQKELTTHPLRRLVDVLRDDFHLMGTKEGCGEGECGACSVLMDDELAISCLLPVLSVHNRSVTTIEGFSKTDRFRSLQKSFEKFGAVQCGFCTPGMILAAEALFRSGSRINRESIREALSGNICRCTGMNMIVEAVYAVAREGDNS